jgi:hypothetical protein
MAGFSQRTFLQRTGKLNWPNLRGFVSAPRVVGVAKRVRRSFVSTTVLTSLLQRARSLDAKALIQTAWRNSAPALVAVVLASTVLIAYRNHRVAETLESAAAPSASAVDQQSILPKPSPGKPETTPPLVSQAKPVTAMKRVRVGPNEVEYIGEDVTVRTFTDKRAAKRSQPKNGRIAHIGDDVTVRYFAPQSPAARTTSR